MPHTIDKNTGATLTVDYPHHEIHAGSHFVGGYYNASMATNDTLELLIVACSGKQAHAHFIAEADAEATAEIYRGVTVTGAGTSVAPQNRNHNSSNPALTTLAHTPTTSGGTLMVTSFIGSGRSLGGESRSESEFILEEGELQPGTRQDSSGLV